MTILSWVAGFQVRTGWHFLSADESSRLSETMTAGGGSPLRAIARHASGARVVCLDAAQPDPRRARVLIVCGDGHGKARVQEEHASLAAWLNDLGLLSPRSDSDAHGRA